MTRILFVAHDPGGAYSFVPVIKAIAQKGYEVLRAGKGPAQEAWSHLPGTQIDPDDLSLETLLPDLVVSGGSFHENYERDVWVAARHLKIPVFFYFDAWTNLKRILTLSDGTVFQPDQIATSCEGSAEVLRTAPWCDSPVVSVGMPVLEEELSKLERVKTDPENVTNKLVFFSEPVASDYPDKVLGFDQFSVFDAMMALVPDDLNVYVQPHMREDRQGWVDHVRDLNVEVTRRALADWIKDGVMVVGINSAILIMAKAIGAPVLSLQLGRTRVANHLLETIDDIVKVTQVGDLQSALLYLELERFTKASESPALQELHVAACARFVQCIQANLKLP